MNYPDPVLTKSISLGASLPARAPENYGVLTIGQKTPVKENWREDGGKA